MTGQQEPTPGDVVAPRADRGNVVNLYVDDRPSEDVILALGVDNLFNEFYVRYLDLRTQGWPGAFA